MLVFFIPGNSCMRWKSNAIFFRGRLEWSPSKGLLPALQCLACMAVAWILSQSIWCLAAPDSSMAVASTTPTVAAQSRQVTARHFFGAVPTSSPASADGNTSAHSAAETRWRLLGTYVDFGGHSRALLFMEGQSETVLAQVGDLLSSGQKVEEVQAERVVLSKAEQRSEVMLRPASEGAPGQVPPENRWGGVGPGSSGRSDPFNKDSR